MSKTMLIDSSHEEETRVVIVDDGRVEDLDFESAAKRQLRGNVYLAKVTRVEPSLQAAFVDFGGNRHGFLAFPEIHPDYYQIPHEDRLALQEEEAAIAAEDDDDEVEEDENLDPDESDTSDENDAEVADEQVKVASKRRKRINRRRYKIQEVIKRGQILLVQAVKEERGNKGAALTTYLSLAGRYSVLMPNTPRGGGISRKIASATDRKRLKKIMDDLDVPQGMGVIVRTAGAKRTKTDIKRDYDYLTKLWNDIRDTTMESIAPALIHEEGNLVKRALRDLYNKDIEEVLIEGTEAYKTAKSFIKLLMPSHAKNVKEHKGDMPLFLEYGVENQIEKSLDATVQLKSGGYLVIHPTEALVSVDVNSGRSTKERNVERTALKTNLEAADEVARQMRLRDLAGLIVIDFIDMDESKNNRAVEKRMKDALSVDRARVQWGKISQFGLMEISRQRRRRSLLDASTTVCRHCDGVGRKRTVESSALKAIRQIEEVAARGKAERIRLTVASDVAHYIVNEKRDELVKIEESLGTFTEVVGDDELIRPHFSIEVLEKRRGGKDRIAEAEKSRRAADKEKAKERAKEKEKERKAEAKRKASEPASEMNDEDAEAQDAPEARQTPEARETSGARETDGEDDKPRRRRRGRRGGRNRRKRDESAEETTSEEAASEDASENEEPEKASETAKPKRRRRAPTRAKATEAEATKDEAGEEAKPSTAKPSTAKPSTAKSSTPRPSTKGRSRKAPSRKPLDGETEAEAPKRRRRAPAKTTEAAEAVDAEAVDAEAKPKRTRKAPAKTAAAKTASAKSEADGSTDVEDTAPKPRRTRRAPGKTASAKTASAKTAPADAEVPAETDAPKRARKAPTRKAPARTTAAKTAPVEKTPAKKTPVKKAPAKKTPAKKASSKATAADAEATAETPKRARKAPARKAPMGTETASDAPAKPTRKRAAKAQANTSKKDEPKKKGWWNRVLGDKS